MSGSYASESKGIREMQKKKMEVKRLGEKSVNALMVKAAYTFIALLLTDLAAATWYAGDIEDTLLYAAFLVAMLVLLFLRSKGPRKRVG